MPRRPRPLGPALLALAYALGLSAGSAPAAAAAPPASAVRPLPQFKPTNQNWYPGEATQRHLTGRVLVQFTVDAGGRTAGAKVVKAQADPLLQQAAVRQVMATQFDPADKNLDPADRRPFYLSVQFCLDECGDLRPFPGYENNQVIIMGVSIPPEKPL
jgi:TonB family protein